MPFHEIRLGPTGELLDGSGILVRQGDRRHDTATFVARDEPWTDRPGTQVRIRWGTALGEQTFFGYVNHVEPYFAASGLPQKRFACIGTSRILLSQLEWAWRRRTADSVVRAVASAAYLSADTEPHPAVDDFVSTGTAWALLVELAERTGYCLACNGTELRFLSPVEAMRRSVVSGPVLALGGNLHRFRPLAGDVPEAGYRGLRVAYGLNPRTGEPFAASQAGSPGWLGPEEAGGSYARTVTAVAHSPGEAAEAVAGEARSERFPILATAEADGDPSVVQASIVYVSGAGGDYSGHWYVLEAEHEVGEGRYRMYLRLGRDAWGSFPAAAGQGRRPRWSRGDPEDARQQAPAPPTILAAGRWRSGWGRRP